MPTVNVTLKKGANPEELENAKKAVAEQGGKVTAEYNLVKAFTAEFPSDSVQALKSNDHIEVEADGPVKTQ